MDTKLWLVVLHHVVTTCYRLRLIFLFAVQVCKKDVKHEYTAILNHLRVKHNMTLTQYTQTYVRPVTTGPPPGEEAESEVLMEAEEVEHSGAEEGEEEMASSSEDQFYVVYSDSDQNLSSE